MLLEAVGVNNSLTRHFVFLSSKNIQYFCMSKNKVAQNPSNNSG
jgi:hypothetical protein